MFFAQSDWFFYLRISCTVHLRAKQDGVPFCFSYISRIFFSLNEVAVPDNSKNATKFGNKAFRDMYFFYFLAINALRMRFKMFGLKMSGRKASVS